MDATWMDFTIRVPEEAEVDVQPEGNIVELSWALPHGRVTLLLQPDDAKALSRRLAELVVLIPGGTPV